MAVWLQTLRLDCLLLVLSWKRPADSCRNLSPYLLMISMPFKMACSLSGSKSWWRSGKVFFRAFITLSRLTMGWIFNNPPSTNMLKHFIIFISAAVSIAGMW